MYRLLNINPLLNLRSFLSVISLLLAINSTFGQDEGLTLTGRVVNENGLPVSGAIISVAEESRIGVSDKNGYFSLKKVHPQDELIITANGYKATRATAVFKEGFQISLVAETDPYVNKIAVPFSEMPLKLVVNSMSTITGDELEKHPVTVLQNALPGGVTGIATYEANSEPGWSQTELYIRGLRTMNTAARQPLIMIDNMERDLSFLDAYPIKTISILKDAAAASIYGMRGANGVFLVTTKRGEAGKAAIQVSQEFGFQALSGLPLHPNAYNYVLTVNQARYLDGLQPLYSDEDIQHYKEASNGTLDPSLRYKYVNTDWYDVMLRNLAPQNRTNLTLSGGNRAARYFVSFTYLRQEGMYDEKWTNYNDGYTTQHILDRFNLRSNVDMDINKFLNVSLDLGGRIDRIAQPLASTWTIFTWGAGENLPINPVYAPNGEFSLPNDNDSKNAAALIARSGIDFNRRRNLYSNITATGNLDFITKGLNIKGTAGFDAYNTFEYTQSQNFNGFYYDPNTGTADDPSSYTYTRKRTATALANPTTIARDMSYNINLIGSLNYQRSFGVHAIDAQVMMRTYRNVVEGYTSSNRYLSYGAIANYSYKNKYIAQASASYMGNDNYAKGNRFGFFPGLSLGWLASEEDWLKGHDLQLLKLRASYGRTGQSVTGVRRYPYQGEYVEGAGYNFGTTQAYQQGAYESAAGNYNIKWELSDMANIGVDFDVWNHQLYGQVDVFKEWRSNILVTRSTIPDIYGVAVPQDSYGKAETKGLEITLGHKKKAGQITYFIEGMLTYNQNKVTEMDELQKTEPYQVLTGRRLSYNGEDGLYFIKEKWASDPALISTSAQDAIDHPEKYPYQGSMKVGNAVFRDANGDRVINDFDRLPYNYTRIPELVPSLKAGFEWHGIDARIIFTAYLNRTVETRENMDNAFGWGGSTTHEVTKTWGYYTDDPTDPSNINALYPRLSTTFSDNDRNYPRNTSNIWIKNGNFLSLRNVEIGYSLPISVISKINLRKLRIYCSGYNLYNWSNFENGFDPESPLNYIWAYPKTKSFSVGLNVGF
ncbi:TonB-linked outer membrane protein, SusC/RagA family [bacterium A37T11]|nr:TonB-linked outer membrane protein, SusC/RagA family [bacterium A37T11]